MEQVYKRNDFIVKFFACLFIAIFLVFTFIGTRVFATDVNFEFNNNSYTINLPSWIEEKNYNYFFYVTPHPDDSSTFWSCLIIAKGDISLKLNGASTTFYCNDGIYDFPVLQSTFSTIKNTTQAYTEPTTFSTSVQPFNIYNGISSSNIQYASNVDVVDYTDNSNVVFQAPPQQVEETTILTPIVQGQEMKPLQEILQILPIVMIVVVGYLALRKGLATLFRFLRTS